MKRLFYLISLVSLFMALSACGKENAGGTDGLAPNSEPEDFEPLQPGQFRAIGPSDVDVVDVAGTKAYPSWSQEESALFRVRWRNNDRIRIWYDRSGSSSGEYSVVAGGGTETATLSLVDGDGDADDETGTYYAVYPASGAVSISGTTFTVTIPAVQNDSNTGTSNIDESAQVMIAKCGPERVLNFKQVCTFIRLGAKYVIPGFYCSQVVISSENSYLAGHLAVKYSGVKPVVTGIVEDAAASHSITLNMAPTAGTKFTDNGSGKPNYAYVYVAPGTYDDLTFTFTMVDGKGNSYTVTKAAPESITFARSTYRQINFTLATDLSAEGTANCYIVNTPGIYYFDASKRGNAEETSVGLSGSISEDLASVAQYHSDGATFIDPLGASNGGYFINAANKRVFFKTQSSLSAGTSLVSVKDASSNTIWSWHLWCNTALTDIKFKSKYDSQYYTFMNMNLGAHQVAFVDAGYNGYYYQWGRKDPFQQDKNALTTPFVNAYTDQQGTLEKTILYPETMYGGKSELEADGATIYTDWWCAGLTSANLVLYGENTITDYTPVDFSKTMFDPCPLGYHVPTLAAAYAFRANSFSFADGMSTIKDADNTTIVFPLVYLRQPNIASDKWGNTSCYTWSCYPGAVNGYPSTPDRSAPRFWITTGGSGYNNASVDRRCGCIIRCQKD